jgi:putative hydrolase of the HAD superfamily
VTIFLDLDGTLLDHDAAERSGAIAIFGAFRHVFPHWEADSFADEWQRLLERYVATCPAGHASIQEDRRAQMRELFGQAWVSLTDSEADAVFRTYLEHYEASCRAFPDVILCLDTLARYPLGIITDGDREEERQKLEAIGVAQYFTHVIASSEVGTGKPDPEIFREACRRAGCDPASSFYVGDRFETDAVGSRAAGLHGIWLDRRGSGACSTDVPTVSSLCELPAVVEKVRAAAGTTASLSCH